MKVLVQARRLTYSYPGGPTALKGVDFELRDGETVALLGPNGSGKSTFSLHINGLLRGEGELEVCGLAMNEANVGAIRRRVGLLFQDPDDQLFMPTVIEDVCFGPLNHGAETGQAFEIARHWLARVGMAHAEKRLPHQLSAGEKRRVAIAGVLALDPEVLVLDEPTTYLDPPGQRELLRLLRELPQAKIVVTHDTWFARAIATRAVFFESGSITGTGTVDDLVERFEWRAE